MTPGADRIKAVRAALLSFYDAAKRDLPWRKDVTAYRTWVSEIMLQQTRVETVIPYFRAFMRSFPTVLALAEASQDQVLAAWSGLGYYRRARMLHDGAKVVARDHGGTMPSTRDGLLGLPGVGPYTAGAIASIAFDEEAPLVDGNVVRVLSRVFGIDRELSPQDPELWALAQALVRGPRPGDLNQALMELGATVCTKSSPACNRCTVAPSCVAHREDKQAVWPRIPPKKAPRKVSLEALVCERDGRLLVCRRSAEGLFGGLWEPPMVERRRGDRRPSSELFEELLGSKVEVARGSSVVRHVLSHRELAVTVRRGRLLGERRNGAVECQAPYEASRFVERADLASLGVSRLSQKIIEALDATKGTARIAEKKPRSGKLR